MNPKRSINKAFLALSISLSIWSLGFAMANSSGNLETALLWRRFSAIGWTSIFSVMLHFLVLLTNQREASRLGKYLYFIHIPAIINMYIFAFSNKMAMIQYNLVKINYGWTNIAVNNTWDYFYYFYYTLYMILGIAVIWQWKNIIKEKTKIKQGNLILGSIILSAVIGSFVDIVSSSFLVNPLPQMGPLFMMISIWAMYYSVKYYDLVNYKKLYRDELIIREKDKQKIFYSISIVFIRRFIYNS